MDNLILALAAVALGYLLLSRVVASRSRISGEQARALVAEGAQLVDVRTPAEYSGRHIPGAINLPVSDLPARLGDLTQDKPVVVYCASGMRSARAARILGRAGFTAHDLGPIAAWPG